MTIPSPNLPTGYYIVRKGRYNTKPHSPHCQVARWLSTGGLLNLRTHDPCWTTANEGVVPADYWDEIGAKVA